MVGNLMQLEGLAPSQAKTRTALEKVLKAEDDMMGWIKLPWETAALKQCQQWFKKVDKKQSVLCVLGIGGSSLGAEAVYHFLQPKKKIIFLSNVDGYYFEKVLKELNFSKTHFLVISKSGQTSETLAQLAYILQLLKLKKLKAKNHISVVTENKKSSLREIAAKLSLSIMDVPENVGGRFSVFSQVGLAPLLWAGVDIKKLLQGARLGSQQKEQISALSDFYLQSFENGKTISVFWFYCDALVTFGAWLEQLWSESLAKSVTRNSQKAPAVSTPLVCIGSTDQHSLLQQFNEGTRDKSFLFFRNLQSEKSSIIKKNKEISEFKLFENKSVGELLRVLSKATQAVLKSKSNPVLEMITQDHSPQTIGALIYFFELVIACMGECLNINAYNQPGVEEGKKITLGTLGDPRYSDFALK